MEITIETHWKKIKIYFDNVLHLWFLKDELVGIQSWRSGEKNFYVELSFTRGTTVTLEYDNEWKWETVLTKLNIELEKN